MPGMVETLRNEEIGRDDFILAFLLGIAFRRFLARTAEVRIVLPMKLIPATRPMNFAYLKLLFSVKNLLPQLDCFARWYGNPSRSANCPTRLPSRTAPDTPAGTIDPETKGRNL
jgi:hypothetical protein